ncbi:unnamed protein product [Parnassius mnemosyne]|uniref:BEN domain-containing protein n=1 Tax=Parnassius mnemosyne TaxID=213953 RepID=A0AAV1KVL4_9NEOP
MSQPLWLLVEWVDERNVFSHYGVVNSDSLVTNESDFHTGKLVFIKNKQGNGARRAQILRLSDNKNYVKELKILLQRQDQQVKNMVSLCMNTIKEMKSGSLYLGTQSTSQQPLSSPGVSGAPQQVGTDTDETTDSEQESNNLSFNKSVVKQNPQYKCAESSVAVYNNRPTTQSSKFYSRRSMVSSTPLPGRDNDENIKLTFDQSTQTDNEMLYPPLPKIEEMESVLNRLYRQFLSLISEIHIDDAMSILSEVSELEQYAPEHSVNETSTMKDESTVEQNGNTTAGGIEDKNQLKPKVLRVRRASAHTTISGEPGNNNADMVPIGSGNVLVPTRLLADLDWTSYTTATRQLLQAVFPRRVLATHCLSGKQSPAFTNKPPKKRLDPKLVDDIIDTVAERCGVHKRLVRSCITTKCTDEAKLYRNRQHYKRMRQMNQNQDNMPLSSASSNASSNARN